MKSLVGAFAESRGSIDHQVVLVRTERAFVQPQHVATFIVQGDRLQPAADDSLLQGFADRGL